MKRLLTGAFGIGMSLFLAGCASNSSIPYQDKHSLAYNIAVNGGIESERLRDVTLTKEQAAHLADSTEFRAADTALSFAIPPTGLTKWQAGGGAALGLASALLSSQMKQMADRIVIMAWMPENNAPDSNAARQKLSNAINTAIEGAIQHIGLEKNASSPSTSEKELRLETSYFVEGEGNGWSCPATDLEGKYEDGLGCMIKTQVFTPEITQAPNVPGLPGGQVYAFTAHVHGKYSFTDWDRWSNINAYPVYEKSSVDEGDLLFQVSQRLPSWVYIYVPAGKVKDKSGDKVDYPFVLNKGKMLLFAVEK